MVLVAGALYEFVGVSYKIVSIPCIF